MTRRRTRQFRRSVPPPQQEAVLLPPGSQPFASSSRVAVSGRADCESMVVVGVVVRGRACAAASRKTPRHRRRRRGTPSRYQSRNPIPAQNTVSNELKIESACWTGAVAVGGCTRRLRRRARQQPQRSKRRGRRRCRSRRHMRQSMTVLLAGRFLGAADRWRIVPGAGRDSVPVSGQYPVHGVQSRQVAEQMRRVSGTVYRRR